MLKNPLLFKRNCMQIFLFGVIQLKLQILFLILFRTVTRFYFGNRLYHIPLRIDLCSSSENFCSRSDFRVVGTWLYKRGAELPSVLQPFTRRGAVLWKTETALILDLSHLNKFIIKKSIKYEDLRTVLQMFSPGVLFFPLISSQLITTLIFARNIGNSCRLIGHLLME